jgi:hypothetical protein
MHNRKKLDFLIQKDAFGSKKIRIASIVGHKNQTTMHHFGDCNPRNGATHESFICFAVLLPPLSQTTLFDAFPLA